MTRSNALIYPILVTALLNAHNAQAATKDQFLNGECIHLGYETNKAYASPVTVDLKLSELGVTSTRDDLVWEILKASSLETFPPKLSHLSYSINVIPLRPLLILRGDSNAIPEGQPKTPETRQAFVDYAKKSASLLKTKNPLFEIWNEWNLGAWNNPKGPGDVENYVELVKVTTPEIKKIMPQGLVLAGAVGDDKDWKWTLRAVDLGIMNYADGLSVHAYNHCMNPKDRTGDEILARLEKLHQGLQTIAPNKEIPIYLTEYGWPTRDKACGGVSEESSAANVAQILLGAPTYPWLKGAWHYELLNEPMEPENRESNFGHYREDGSMKPSGCVAKTIWDFIADYSPVDRLASPQGNTMVVYASGNKKRVAVWSQKTNQKIFIPATATSQPYCGFAQAAPGKWTQIGPAPLLIEVPATHLPAIKIELGE